VLITLVVVVAVIFIAAMSVQYAAAFSFKSWNELHPDEPLCYTLKTREERDACYDGIDPSTVRDNDNTVKNNPPSPPSSSSSEQQQKQKTTTTTTTTNTNFLTYKNSNHGLTIQYPANWDKDELAEGGEYTVFFSPSTNMDVNLDVSVYKPNDIPSFPYNNTTLTELVDREIDDLRSNDICYQGIIWQESTLVNNPSYKIMYDSICPVSKTMEVWMLKDGKAYEIEYTSEYTSSDANQNKLTATSQFFRYLPIAQKMIDSFKIDAADAATTVTPRPESPGPQQQPGQEPTTEPRQQQSPADPSGNYAIINSIVVMIIIALIVAIIAKFRHRGRGKYRERRGFPDYIKEEVLRKQNHRCADCNRILNVVDWDHIDGNRSNNKESNCQALCPNCHAVKSRSGREE
jgi:hypothetical protein